jgi:hypothetical protein
MKKYCNALNHPEISAPKTTEYPSRTTNVIILVHMVAAKENKAINTVKMAGAC